MAVISVSRGPAPGWRLRRRLRAAARRSEQADALTPAELSVASQNGEDGVLAAILERIGPGTRFFVEFGIGGGEQGNCVLLADWLDWHGLFIESDPDGFERLSRKYSQRNGVQTVNAAVTAANVEALFTRCRVPERFDVLSIDIDGNDFWVWQAIVRFRPRVVVIEYNANLPLDAKLVMPRDDGHRWDGTTYFGASLGALRDLGRTRRYELVHTDSTGVNAFFVASEEAGPLPRGGAVPLHSANYLGGGLALPRDPRGRPFQPVGGAV